jgi:hypothetical protein
MDSPEGIRVRHENIQEVRWKIMRKDCFRFRKRVEEGKIQLESESDIN